MLWFSQVLVLVLALSSASALKNPCKKNGAQQYFSHPDFPSKYIQCTDWGQMFVFACASPLVWNGEIEGCDYASKILSALTTVAPHVETAAVEHVLEVKPAKQEEDLPQASVKGPCMQLSVKDSKLTTINGIYKKDDTEKAKSAKFPTYLKNENEVIVPIGNLWCITDSFTVISDLNDADRSEKCGMFNCCLRMSNLDDGIELTDPKKVWIINQGEKKGTIDSEIKVTCNAVTGLFIDINIPEAIMDSDAELMLVNPSVIQTKPVSDPHKPVTIHINPQITTPMPKVTTPKPKITTPVAEVTTATAILTSVETPVETPITAETPDDLKDIFEREIRDLKAEQEKSFIMQEKLIQSRPKEQSQKMIASLNSFFAAQMNALKKRQDKRWEEFLVAHPELNSKDQDSLEIVTSAISQKLPEVSLPEVDVNVPTGLTLPNTLTELEQIFLKEVKDLKTQQKVIADENTPLLRTKSRADAEAFFTKMNEFFQKQMDDLKKSQEDRRNKFLSKLPALVEKHPIKELIRHPITTIKEIVSELIDDDKKVVQAPGPSSFKSTKIAKSLSELEEIFEEELTAMKDEQSVIFEQQKPLLIVKSGNGGEQMLDALKSSFTNQIQRLKLDQEKRKRDFLAQHVVITKAAEVSLTTPVTPKAIETPKTPIRLEDLELTFKKESEDLKIAQREAFNKQIPQLHSTSISIEEKTILFNDIKAQFQKEMDELKEAQKTRRDNFLREKSMSSFSLENVLPTQRSLEPLITTPLPHMKAGELKVEFEREMDELTEKQRIIFNEKSLIFKSPIISDTVKEAEFLKMNQLFKEQKDTLLTNQEHRRLVAMKGESSHPLSFKRLSNHLRPQLIDNRRNRFYSA